MTAKIHFDFDEAKATQIAALLIKKSGGASDHYLLMKCLYDLDREALSLWGQPVVGGTYKRYEHGPIIQEAYQVSKVGVKSFYSDHIHRADNEVRVLQDPGTDELSQAERELAEKVWKRWRDLNFAQARKKIHALPESDDKNLPGDDIPVKAILRHCGKSEKFIQTVAEDAKASQTLKSVFGL